MDDDQLNKRICEESNESNDDNANVVYECCACHEAKFEVCIYEISLKLKSQYLGISNGSMYSFDYCFTSF